MKDRGGADYIEVFQRIYRADENPFSASEQAIGHVRVVGLLSPTRQREKALGLSGRQLRKWRKSLRVVAALKGITQGGRL